MSLMSLSEVMTSWLTFALTTMVWPPEVAAVAASTVCGLRVSPVDSAAGPLVGGGAAKVSLTVMFCVALRLTAKGPGEINAFWGLACVGQTIGLYSI